MLEERRESAKRKKERAAADLKARGVQCSQCGQLCLSEEL